MMRPPAVDRLRFSCERRAQSSSGTSIDDGRERRVAPRAAARAASRLDAERKNTRHRVGVVGFLDRDRGEVVELRVEAVAEDGIGSDRER